MPARPCLTCRQPTTAGSRCLACQAVWNQAHGKRRGTRQQRGYTNEWFKLAAEAIEAQPWCSVPGCIRDDLTGDHRVPLARGGTNTRENVGVLCRHHNSQRRDRPWDEWLAEAAREERRG